MTSSETRPPHAVFVLFWSVLTPRNQLMVQSLVEQGWRVSVIAWDRSGDGVVSDDQASRVSDWHWIRLPVASSRLALFGKLPAFIRAAGIQLARQGPVELTFLTHFFLLLLARRARGKKIYEAAEFFAWDLSKYFGRVAALARPALIWWETRALRHVDGILTVDSKNGWLESQYRRVRKPVVVLWNVPSASDDPPEETVDEAAANLGERKVMISVGGLLFHKGLTVMLEAARYVCDKHPDALLLLIGTLKESEVQVRATIQRLGLGENVRILAQMPYRTMLAHVRCADVGLATYQGERYEAYIGQGGARKIFTYMQAGIPVIAPATGASGELVKSIGCGVLADTTSSRAVAAAVCELLEDDGARNAAGRTGRQAFENRFNWARESRRFVGLIEDVCPAAAAHARCCDEARLPHDSGGTSGA